MFSVGFLELVLVMVVALLVLGPERLPGAVRQAAQGLNKARRWMAAWQSTLEEQLDPYAVTRPQHHQRDRSLQTSPTLDQGTTAQLPRRSQHYFDTSALTPPPDKKQHAESL